MDNELMTKRLEAIKSKLKSAGSIVGVRFDDWNNIGGDVFNNCRKK